MPLDEGWELINNSGLAGLPTANKLWVITVLESEADIGPTAVLADFTQAFATKRSVTGRTSVGRIIDLGALNWPETTGFAVGLLVCTNDPAVAGAKALTLMNIYDDGSVYDAATAGALYIDELSMKSPAYQGEN